MEDTMADKPIATPQFRLPGDVVPVHYHLDIFTDLENFNFHGDVKIQIKCLQSTDTIKIHSSDLTIDSKNVLIKPVGDNTKPLAVIHTSLDVENEFFIIKAAQLLEKLKEFKIHIPFKGVLKENLVGYYRSQYFDRTSQSNKFLAVTHFEPSNARQAFPCFDEPGMKATFNIRLAHKKTLTAVSNMPLKSTYPHENNADFVWSEFEKSVPMSTYLVAYMVSEFSSVLSEAESPNNITFRVWARKDAIGQAGFPGKVGPHFLSFYEDFFGVKYPLPKEDLLAIPDFKIGAMENWGIITFRESYLLLDESTTTSSVRLNIASIIAHELAHMWFGNLVTMWWWTDLWLKEGFATYMAGLAVHHEFPQWNSLDEEDLSTLLRVFHLDSMKSSHPVSVPMGHSKEISQIFDAISYDKGAFLLRMMSLFLGKEVFRRGVSEYLKKHQYGNAEQDDLWASLTEQAHRHSVLPEYLSVKQIMDTWTLQTGFPLLTVTRDYEHNKITVSQKRYLGIKPDKEADCHGSWWVPLSFATEKEPNFNRTQPEHWLSQNEESKVLDIKTLCDEWIIFNNKAAGLYKVNYDLKNWQLLKKTLNSGEFEEIDVMNRALLIVDAMDLADRNVISYELALSLVNYVKRETVLVPWRAALSKLEPLKAKLCRTPIYGDFKEYLRSLLSPIARKLLTNKDLDASFEESRMMNVIFPWAASLGISEIGDLALLLFDKWSKSDNPDADNFILKDIRPTVYSHAVAKLGEKAWNFLWERYKNANVVAEKNNILMSLTNAQEAWIINRYLQMTLDEVSGIRKQDAFIVFQELAHKEMGFYVAQKFFYRNIKCISDYFGSNSDLIGNYFYAIADQIVFQDEFEELKAFAEKHKTLLVPASLIVEQALESAQLNIHWMESHYASLSQTLKAILA